MKLQNLVSGVIGLSATILMQSPVASQYQPNQTVYLNNFANALNKAGFLYGNYDKLPYCFGTSETIDGRTPIVVICPLATPKRDSPYTTDRNGSVSAIWMSILISSNSSRETTRYAVEKAGLVARVFANIRYNVTASSMGGVLEDEFNKTVNGVDAREYTNNSGALCRFRQRNLVNVGIFETRACAKTGSMQITFWF